jgi:hypothetical protein
MLLNTLPAARPSGQDGDAVGCDGGWIAARACAGRTSSRAVAGNLGMTTVAGVVVTIQRDSV